MQQSTLYNICVPEAHQHWLLPQRPQQVPVQHKTGTIKPFIHRAYEISSTWTLFHQVVQQLKQSLINNGYSSSQFDSALNKHLQQIQNTDSKPTIEDGSTHRNNYRNQVSASYKEDEKALKRINKNNITCIEPVDKLQVLIYYKNNKVSNLTMRNNPSPSRSKANRHHLRVLLHSREL